MTKTIKIYFDDRDAIEFSVNKNNFDLDEMLSKKYFISYSNEAKKYYAVNLDKVKFIEIGDSKVEEYIIYSEELEKILNEK